MKTIAFFSEKGGVGKSSFSILYASWLKYQHGLKVALADFNDRISNYRDAEIAAREELIKKNPEIKPFDLEKAWPIVECDIQEIIELKKSSPIFPYADWLSKEIKHGRLKGYDVVLLDFPGNLNSGEFVQINKMDMVGLTVIPTEKDQMTLDSTLLLSEYLKSKHYCCFINKVQLSLDNFKRQYAALSRILKENYNVKLLPDYVTLSDRMTTIDKVDIIRSTFGYPDFNGPAFKGSRDLGIENLFIDVTRLLQKAKNIPGTDRTDLSFVNSMTKKNDGRQFAGSSFPEFEIV